MITFPCAKINLGLNIVGELENGYHSIETVFYPVPIYDALEIKYMDEKFPSESPCDLKVTGNRIECDEQKNLVLRAYQVLAKDFTLPRVHAHLYKQIPTQAGLGGGSSDGAFMIRLLDERFRLNIGNPEMERYAAKLGADCAFFISAEPSFGAGMGNLLEPADGPRGNLSGYFIAVVKPDISISTSEAFRGIECRKPRKCCREVVRQPIETWKTDLTNDFEKTVFALWPELKDIKQRLYDHGAVYAQMSGSGSAVYGIFRQKPSGLEEEFQGCCLLVIAFE
mgnify:CR=1 FL=1